MSKRPRPEPETLGQALVHHADIGGFGGRSGPARPVGIAGEVGASYAIVKKNWTCPKCSKVNFPSRFRCQRCRAEAPQCLKDAVNDSVAKPSHSWKEAFDPESRQIYYFDTATGRTQWNRPEAMGPAPTATGWFGRGASSSTVAAKYDQLNTEWLKRPARNQAPTVKLDKLQRREGLSDYNIWYGRHDSSNQWEMNKEPAEHRCVTETDAGWTQADRTAAKSGDRNYFCVHFAKGQCARGHKCRFYHRVPTASDDAKCDLMHDIFGRKRHRGHRHDMSGVGSFESDSRTLFVGGLHQYDDVLGVLKSEFAEWGEVENVNYIARLSAAFVRYRLRANAEFAKVAMGNQRLGGKGVIDVKWAHDDPNPVARKSAMRADADAIIAAMQARGAATVAAGFDYPQGYEMPAMKRARLADPSSAYPDTDGQYNATGAGSGSGPAAIEDAAAKATAAKNAELATAAAVPMPHGVAGGAAMARAGSLNIGHNQQSQSYNYDYTKAMEEYWKRYAEWSSSQIAAAQSGKVAAAPAAAAAPKALTGLSAYAGADSDDEESKK